eukprot:5403606-Prorocentrum_lima.AAC.1
MLFSTSSCPLATPFLLFPSWATHLAHGRSDWLAAFWENPPGCPSAGALDLGTSPEVCMGDV